jgi:kynurenine formamidase
MTEPERPMEPIVKGAPSNWGRWGEDDEIGALNYMTAASVLAAMGQVRSGKVFTLGIPIARREGDPLWPGRSGAVKLMVQDRGHYLSGKLEPMAGGAEYADDYLGIYLQGSTQYDALGHVWLGDQLYNGFDAASTLGGMARCGVDKLAERGNVGRGVLLDIPRLRGKPYLDAGETFGLDDLLAAAEHHGVTIQKGDNLLIRTGFLGVFYDQGPEVFYGQETFVEPGLVYSRELAEWFQETEIVSLSTDTIANEVTYDPETGFLATVHVALMVNLGVIFSEICRLDPLADDCAQDGQYSFLYVAAPINIAEGAGAPVNPVVVK